MCGCLQNDPNYLEKRHGSKQGGLEIIDLTLKTRALLLLYSSLEMDIIRGYFTMAEPYTLYSKLLSESVKLKDSSNPNRQ